jgi:hypothetical protein
MRKEERGKEKKGGREGKKREQRKGNSYIVRPYLKKFGKNSMYKNNKHRLVKNTLSTVCLKGMYRNNRIKTRNIY